MTEKDKTINYIELSMQDSAATQQFYHSVFGWQFQEWGDDYISFSGAGIDGGFSSERALAEQGIGTLVVLYADDLEATLESVESAGAEISVPIFEFPGGRRFHFRDPNGNELAIWSTLPEPE